MLGGVLVGVGLYTFFYARGWAYLTKNPEACLNCHIMRPQYDGWIHSSHRLVADCNSCHTPSNFFGKWYTKASNGFWHSYYFTTGTFHEPIQITKRNLRITEKRCQECHAAMTSMIHAGKPSEGRWCTRCHANVGHMY